MLTRMFARTRPGLARRLAALLSLSLAVGAASVVASACVGDDPTAAADASSSATATTTATTPPPAGDGGGDSAAPDASLPDSAPPADTGAPDASGGVHLVFVTDAKVNGAFAGGGDPWAAADAVCATEATANSLSGTFVAWLSWETPAGTKFSAASRITDAAYQLPGGVDGSAPVLIAASKTELLTSGPRAEMNRTASGALVDFDENPLVAWVWTGSTATGAPATSDNCKRWTSALASDFGTAGNARRIPAFAPSDWTSLGGRQCDLKRRFYCFQK